MASKSDDSGPRRTRRQSVIVGWIALFAVGAIASVTLVLARDEPDWTIQKPLIPDVGTTLDETSHLAGPRTVQGAREGPEPTPSDPATLQRFGAYRLVPSTYVGDLPYRSLGASPRSGVQTSDARILADSPLYVDLRPPEDLARVLIDTFDGDSETVVRQLFRSDNAEQEVEVTRVLRRVEPIDVLLPPSDGTSALVAETTQIAGREVLWFVPVPGEEIPLIQLKLYGADAVDTTITAWGLGWDEVRGLAEQVIEASTGGSNA